MKFQIKFRSNEKLIIKIFSLLESSLSTFLDIILSENFHIGPKLFWWWREPISFFMKCVKFFEIILTLTPTSFFEAPTPWLFGTREWYYSIQYYVLSALFCFDCLFSVTVFTLLRYKIVWKFSNCCISYLSLGASHKVHNAVLFCYFVPRYCFSVKMGVGGFQYPFLALPTDWIFSDHQPHFKCLLVCHFVCSLILCKDMRSLQTHISIKTITIWYERILKKIEFLRKNAIFTGSYFKN